MKCCFSETIGGVEGFNSYMNGELRESEVERFVIEEELRQTTAVMSTSSTSAAPEPRPRPIASDPA